MKVLFLLYRGNPFCGGQGIYLYNLTKELSKLGVEIDVIVGPPYPQEMDEWANTYRLENLHLWATKTKGLPLEKLKRIFSPWNFLDYILTRFHIFPEMQTFSFRAFFFLKKLLKEKQYDLIHDIQTLGWGLLPMKGFGIPIVTILHHPLTRDRNAELMAGKTFWDRVTTLLFYPIQMQKFVINRIERTITSFNEGVNELNRAFALPKEKITVVYNGMDVKLFQNSGKKREENALLFVGNTEDTKKGLIYLLEAMTLLPEKVTLTIVDDGPPVKITAYKEIERLGLLNRIKFTGKISDKRLVDLYSSKTLLVMSSLYEGFGLPAAEAMACETAVVATAVGALPEVVSSECGILVQPMEPAALKDAIIKLLEDKELRISMGKKGRKRAVKNFSWPVAAKNTYDVYVDVIKKYRSR